MKIQYIIYIFLIFGNQISPGGCVSKSKVQIIHFCQDDLDSYERIYEKVQEVAKKFMKH